MDPGLRRDDACGVKNEGGDARAPAFTSETQACRRGGVSHGQGTIVGWSGSRGGLDTRECVSTCVRNPLGPDIDRGVSWNVCFLLLQSPDSNKKEPGSWAARFTETLVSHRVLKAQNGAMRGTKASVPLVTAAVYRGLLEHGLRPFRSLPAPS